MHLLIKPLPGAEQMGHYHIAVQKDPVEAMLSDSSSPHTLPNQKCLFIILPNTTDFYL